MLLENLPFRRDGSVPATSEPLLFLVIIIILRRAPVHKFLVTLFVNFRLCLITALLLCFSFFARFLVFLLRLGTSLTFVVLWTGAPYINFVVVVVVE